MIRKNVFLILILFAYSITVAHSLIPHHHHTDKAHQNHHSGDHHNSANEAHDDDNHSTNPIEFFAHSGPGVEFQTPIVQVDCSVLSAHFIISFLENDFTLEDESPPGSFRLDDVPLQSRFIVSSKGLRAPPLA